jgi:divalent metal cation (Fe/Co/Zn/Cd) transporter
MTDGWPRSWPYTIGTIANWTLFLLAVWLLAWGSGPGRLPQPALWTIVLAITASVAVQFLAAYRLIARQDEYIRAITAKRIVAAAGVTLTAAVLWGLGQQFLGLPVAPMWVVYPLFWGLFGTVTPFIRDTRP